MKTDEEIFNSVLEFARKGYPDFQYSLGSFYESGLAGCPRDEVKAAGWYRLAAEQGHTRAQINIGLMCAEGCGVPKDEVEAVAWFRRAAEQGDAFSYVELGFMYADGRGVPKDEVEAAVWFHRAAEHTRGDERVYGELGLIYADGRGVTKDEVAAAAWYRRAAELGDRFAQVQLGLMYAEGRGVAKDDVQAVSWYRRAAEHGDSSTGTGVSDKMGQFWYRPAADQGDSSAQVELGLMYAEGRGVQKDETQAVAWYRRAAEQGDAQALTNLGTMYEHGRGVEKDAVEALACYHRAANWRYALAQVKAGEMYEKGFGVLRDLEKARRWFEEAIINQSATPQGLVLARSGIDRLNRIANNADGDALAEAMSPIQSMIGLEGVKKEIQSLAKWATFEIERKSHGLESSSISLHLVFTGNPGTGKTTVAKHIGRIYAALGLLAKGHLVDAPRQSLVSKFVGQTAHMTQARITEALDGVLFIDEAYSLASSLQGDYGYEAVATLIAGMENHRDRLAVIVAGYTTEMKQFIEMNPGLRSRFNCFIEFDDYQPSELAEIFLKYANDDNYRLDDDAQAALEAHFIVAFAMRGKDFGNARYVRNLFDQSKKRHASRVLKAGLQKDRESLVLLTAADLPISE